MLLRTAHKEYQEKLFEQQQMYESGEFFKRIAAAFSRMPNARRLEIRDKWHMSKWDGEWITKGIINSQKLVDQCLVDEFIMRPNRWDEIIQQNLGHPPVELLVKLPQAIHQAGVFLEDIDIHQSLPHVVSALSQDFNDLRDLTAAVQKLKYFEFISKSSRSLREGPWDNDDRDHVRHIRDFLHAMINTSSLRTVSVAASCRSGIETGAVFFDTGCAFFHNFWPNLRNLIVESSSFHLNELDGLIKDTKGPLSYLSLCNPHLLSGTWAEALDILRTKPATECAALEDPTGAECETLSVEDYNAIFERPEGVEHNQGSKAEKYIRGLPVPNPLRELDAEYAEADILQDSESENLED